MYIEMLFTIKITKSIRLRLFCFLTSRSWVGLVAGFPLEPFDFTLEYPPPPPPPPFPADAPPLTFIFVN